MLDIACKELKISQIAPRLSNLQAIFIYRDAQYEETNPKVEMNLPLSCLFVIHVTVTTKAFFLIPITNIAKNCNSCLSLFSAFAFLKHLIHVTVTSFLTTLTVVWDTLVKAHQDAISLAEDLPKAGIASMVQLVLGCPPNAQLNVAVVHMLQGGWKEVILPWLRGQQVVKFVTIGQVGAVNGVIT